MLTRGLVARGHEVTLFAHADSRSAGHFVPWPGRASRSRRDTARNAATLTHRVATERLDIVHSFSRLTYLTPILPMRLPKLMSYQRAISPRTTALANRLASGSLEFTAISRWMISAAPLAGRWHVIPNGVPLDIYDFHADSGADAPLVFLGRIEEIKGPHLAIEAARLAGQPLVIAGNVSKEHEGFFRGKIKPHVDGEIVRYIGPVDDAEKNALLGHARALLMPVLWEEPFGIVMVEAMACGTPVIGFGRGAVPEVVEHGVTGFVVDDVKGMAAAAGRLDAIDRSCCRARVEQLYSETAVVDAYIRVYEQMLAAHGRGMMC
jgi:glycosyltransferase involved in cell wall biosynthesis